MKGTYTIEQDYDNEVGDEYIITITTYDRVVDGKKYTDKYTTKFSIVTEDYEEAAMMNVVTYTIYYLTKINNTTPSSSSSSYSSYSSNTISNSTNTLTNSTTTNTLSTNTTTNSVSGNTTSSNSNILNTNSYYTNTTSYNTIH